MKFILISDLHLLNKQPLGRVDDTPETLKKKIIYILNSATKYDATILQAGDFTDGPRNWGLLSWITEIFSNWQINRLTKKDFYCIFGQHDTYLYSEKTRDKTILGVLAKANLVNILGSEPVIFTEGPRKDETVAIYGCSYGMDVPKTNGINNQLKILVIHKEISDAPLFKDHEYTSAMAFLKKNKDFDLIICGDIHRRFKLSLTDENKTRYIVNTGPLLRRSVDEWDHKPGFYIFDSMNRSFTWQEIPHAPSKEVLTRDHIEKREETVQILEDFIKAVKSEKIQGLSFRENFNKFLKENDDELGQGVKDILSEVMMEDL